MDLIIQNKIEEGIPINEFYQIVDALISVICYNSLITEITMKGKLSFVLGLTRDFASPIMFLCIRIVMNIKSSK
jgi:hypothetical protein